MSIHIDDLIQLLQEKRLKEVNMIRVVSKPGQWEKEKVERVLRREVCSNPRCQMRAIYPTYMVNPFCPDCREPLLGADMNVNAARRIIYHLET